MADSEIIFAVCGIARLFGALFHLLVGEKALGPSFTSAVLARLLGAAVRELRPSSRIEQTRRNSICVFSVGGVLVARGPIRWITLC